MGPGNGGGVNDTDGFDRRAHPRYPVDVPVGVRKLGYGRAQHLTKAKLRDLSVGGMRLEATGLNVGDVIEVALPLRDESVLLRGLVVAAAVGTPRAHVAFSALNAPTVALLSAFLTPDHGSADAPSAQGAPADHRS